MVEAMDVAADKMLAKLDELGLSENTLVIFSSDNGGLSTSEAWPTSNLPLRGVKGWLYESGIREPLLARWPAVIQSGRVVHTPVSNRDFFPTFLEVVGVKPQPGQVLDGVRLVSLLKDGVLPGGRVVLILPALRQPGRRSHPARRLETHRVARGSPGKTVQSRGRSR